MRAITGMLQVSRIKFWRSVVHKIFSMTRFKCVQVYRNRNNSLLKNIYISVIFFIKEIKVQYYNMHYLYITRMKSRIHQAQRFTLVNVNAPVVATTSWWLHFTAPVVA